MYTATLMQCYYVNSFLESQVLLIEDDQTETTFI